MTGKTSSMTGKSIKILINNVPMTSENDLKAIAANKIKRWNTTKILLSDTAMWAS